MRLRALSALGVVTSLTAGAFAMSAAPAIASAPKLSTTVTKKAASTASSPSSVTTLPDVVVTMVDTGVRATHQEFNYGGSTDTTDQFVAWWDFSGEASNHLPTAGQTWDTTFADPYDGFGHGTATASAAVGANAAPATTKMPSFAPGFKLAVAKVGEADGTVSGDLAEAIKWARETVHTDVISMSIGAIVPLPSFLTVETYHQIRLAREAGILVVVSNGNGFANAGVPGEPGFATPYGNSPYALGVGARGLDGPLVTTDPEVTSEFFDVPLACQTSDSCYAPVTGTSFAAPLVAGFAAHLIQTNRANGFDGNPNYIEKLVKYSALDTVYPPTFEGYGRIDAAQQSAAESNAAAGTLPARPTPDVNALYVETLQGTLDTVWADKLGEGAQNMVGLQLGAPTPTGTIGPSAPTGVGEAEFYRLNATAGDTVTVDLSFLPPDAVNDVDVYVLYHNPDSSLTFPSSSELVASSNNAAGVAEHAEFTAHATGRYDVIVLGWSVVVPQAISLSSNKALSFYEQDYVLHTFGTGLLPVPIS